MIETLSRKLHGYKVEFTSYSKAWRSSIKAKEDSENPELVEQDIKRFKAQADKYAELIRETKEQISVEYNKQKAKRKAVDVVFMDRFFEIKGIFYDCYRESAPFDEFNKRANLNISEEDYKNIWNIDINKTMETLQDITKKSINKNK